jgi:hypothetical protein
MAPPPLDVLPADQPVQGNEVVVVPEGPPAEHGQHEIPGKGLNVRVTVHGHALNEGKGLLWLGGVGVCPWGGEWRKLGRSQGH